LLFLRFAKSGFAGALFLLSCPPDITTDLLFAFRGFIEFLKDPQQLISFLFRGRFYNSLQFLRSPSRIVNGHCSQETEEAQ